MEQGTGRLFGGGDLLFAVESLLWLEMGVW